MRTESQDEVQAFIAARRPALYRSAYLLVGNVPTPRTSFRRPWSELSRRGTASGDEMRRRSSRGE